MSLSTHKSKRTASKESEEIFKTPTASMEDNSEPVKKKEESPSNGNQFNGTENGLETRSSRRSRTPQMKKNGIDSGENKEKEVKETVEKEIFNSLGNTENSKEPKENEQEIKTEDVAKTDETKEVEEVEKKEENLKNGTEKVIKGDEKFVELESEEMDSLVLAEDEPCPELQFDDNTDSESGKFSPISPRCKTRRSQVCNTPTSNTPTPNTPTSNTPTLKTPKLLADDISKPSTPCSEVLDKEDLREQKEMTDNDNSVNTENASTEAVAGGNSTRGHLSDLEESTFLSNLKSFRSFSERPKLISGRKSIRDIRRNILRQNLGKADLSMPLFGDDSMDRAPSVKRKGRSETPDSTKRFKGSSPGLLSRIASPLTSLREHFGGSKSDHPSTSTPKLIAYKDQHNVLGEGEDMAGCRELVVAGIDADRKWCTIM